MSIPYPTFAPLDGSPPWPDDALAAYRVQLEHIAALHEVIRRMTDELEALRGPWVPTSSRVTMRDLAPVRRDIDYEPLVCRIARRRGIAAVVGADPIAATGRDLRLYQQWQARRTPEPHRRHRRRAVSVEVPL